MALRALVTSERTNAAVGWALTGVVALVAVGSLLSGPLLWGVFVLLLAVVAAVPATVTGEWTVMVPWPLLAVGAVASGLRALGRFPEVASAVAVATLALIAVVELDAFTEVDMSRRFAVGFAVLTTMALQGLWTVAQFYSDRWLKTTFLTSQTELQWDIVTVAAVALAMGGFFVWYFERFEHIGSHARPNAPPRHP